MPEVATPPKTETITIELVPAIAEDLKEVDYYKELGPGNYKKVMKLRHGLPYWIKSKNTNQIEPHPYLLQATTPANQLAEYLADGTIYIAKHPFK